MLKGNTLGVVVANYSPELERLKGRPHVYFAKSNHAWAILEGMRNYGFLQQADHSERGPFEHEPEHGKEPSQQLDDKQHA
jgi:sucrose-phosphate synthase